MAGLCSTCPHPGGEALTERMAALACFKPGDRVLDVGCGSGATLRLLAARGIDAVGLELLGESLGTVLTDSFSSVGDDRAAILAGAVPSRSAAGGESPESPGTVLTDSFAPAGESLGTVLADSFLTVENTAPLSSSKENSHVYYYDGITMPFADAVFDGVFMECVLSCAEDPGRLLREALRVLKPDGTLAVSDLAARGGADESPRTVPGDSFIQNELPRTVPTDSLIQNESTRTVPNGSLVLTREAWRACFTAAGFCVYYEEDATDALTQLFGQLLLDGGEEAVEQAIGLDRETRRRLKPGYRLWILVPDRCQELAEATADAPLTGVGALTGDRPQLLAAPPKEIARIITVPTSGSTGEKKRIYFTDADLQKTADFFTPGMAPMIDAGDTVTVFMRGSGTYSIAGLLDIAVRRLDGTVVNYGDLTDLNDAAKAAEKTDCLVMMPGDTAALAALCPGLRPKSVLLSADHIPQSIARRVVQTWKCRLFLHWGMTETGYGGAVTAAPDGPYLLRRDLFAETIDPDTGRRLPPGAEGEIVITTVGREGMPLVRYRTGDLGRIAVNGDRRPVLYGLSGRLTDTLRLADGRSISIHILDEIFYNEPDLVWYEAALAADGTLAVGLQGLPGTEEPLKERLADLVRTSFGLTTTFYPAAFRTGKRRLEDRR